MHGNLLVSAAANPTCVAETGRLVVGLAAIAVFWVVGLAVFWVVLVPVLRTTFGHPHLRLDAALKVQTSIYNGDKDNSHVYSRACPAYPMCGQTFPRRIVRHG